MSDKKEELYPCPCCKATKCIMDEPCLGCETYGEWLNKRKSISVERIKEEIYGFMGYCGVRYSIDKELALSDKDQEEVNRTAKAIKQAIEEGE